MLFNVPAASRRSPSRRRRSQRRASWGLKAQTVLADLQAHPGTTYRQMARRLAGTEDKKLLQSISTHVGVLRRELGHDIRVDKERATGLAHLTYVSGPG
jgi:hypothetical protein